LEVLVIIEKGEIRLSWCYEEDDCIVARGLVVGTTVSMLFAERMKRSFSVEKKSISLLLYWERLKMMGVVLFGLDRS
jgi:hypothetical protein